MFFLGGVDRSPALSTAMATGHRALAQAFRRCKAAGRTAFVPYLTCGFPSIESTVPALLAAQAGGADIIEVCRNKKKEEKKKEEEEEEEEEESKKMPVMFS